MTPNRVRVQRLAGHRQGDQGVGKGGRFRVADDGVDLGPLKLDALEDGGFQLGRSDRRPRRHTLIGSGPRLQQFGARRLLRQDGAGDGRVTRHGLGRQADGGPASHAHVGAS